MVDDVVVNKVAILERCLARLTEVYAGNPRHLREDLTRQDSILLNLQRACEASIDLAMHLVRRHRLGVPQESRDAFDSLEQRLDLPSELAGAMRRMVGFRNVAIHGYRKLDVDIVQAILGRHLGEFEAFGRWALERMAERGA
jgi:uncharacterized protein YutE (UPF0331/DUF86 family)